MKLFSIFSLFLILSGVTEANFAWDCTKSIGTCQNYRYAAKCGRMGRRRFTYDSNAKARPGCLTASGCSRNPCNSKNLKFFKFGNLCDEFPFASVQEGGRNAHLRCVNINENRSEGGQLRGFYRTIKNGDKFGITVKNYRRAQDLKGTEEFDPDEEDEFVLDEALETDDGEMHLVIADDPDGPISVGHEIWSESVNGTVRVIREIFE
ncbi:hypothetical protein SI65_09205 [Aspergillus cristatus]|uniref:Deoxyribonuclease NucA/NucB domain-containing protein n=1 Tax=Aspergillus cristatus TaxID=573508 RepID=A0A1E3B2W2_ASPCR|nr:hypothetical protein SI65_09205 [Aspergillus cristatus]